MAKLRIAMRNFFWILAIVLAMLVALFVIGVVIDEFVFVIDDNNFKLFEYSLFKPLRKWIIGKETEPPPLCDLTIVSYIYITITLLIISWIIVGAILWKYYGTKRTKKQYCSAPKRSSIFVRSK